MTAKQLKLEELKEGEYELPFGKVTVNKTAGGYRVVIHIDEKAAGKATARQILQSLLGSGGRQV